MKAYLLLLPVLGCAEASQPITVSFAPVFAGEAAQCDRDYAGVGTTSATVQLADARMYVSSFALVAGGEATPITLDSDTPWQTEDVALLDFEDATGRCAESGTTETNTTVTGSVPAGEYTALRFEVGIPFELNHSDLSAADSPLNLSSMFWTWAGGRKFARIDLVVDTGAPPPARWSFHLGSAQCTSAGHSQPPTEPCGRPNRVFIELAGFDVDDATVQIDLGALFADSDVTTNTENTATGCQSVPDESGDCEPVFANLGMSFSTGACMSGCAEQSVFSLP